MTNAELIELARNKIARLEHEREQAWHAGDEARVIDIDARIAETNARIAELEASA